jgi:hypothetical protein
MSNAICFRQKAKQCRRLAGGILVSNDRTAEALFTLAVEFDNRAAALEAETATVGYGDDIGDHPPKKHKETQGRLIML